VTDAPSSGGPDEVTGFNDFALMHERRTEISLRLFRAMGLVEALQREVIRAIEVCRAALFVPKRRRPQIDDETFARATGLLESVRCETHDDDVLADIIWKCPDDPGGP